MNWKAKYYKLKPGDTVKKSDTFSADFYGKDHPIHTTKSFILEKIFRTDAKTTWHMISGKNMETNRYTVRIEDVMKV